MNRYLDVFFKFYIQSSIHVSVAVVALFLTFVSVNKIPIDWNSVFFVFFASVSGYNFVKYAGIAKLHHRSLTKSLRSIQILSLISFLVVVYFIFKLSVNCVMLILVTGLLTFLYAIPIGKGKNFRSISGLKIFIVAFCWAISTVILPAIHYELTVNFNLFVNFIQIFLLVICLIIPFDIRDLQYDDKNLGTLPQKMGIKGVKKLGVFLLVVFLLLEIFITKSNNLLAVTIVSGLTMLSILFSPKPQVHYFCSFWVESIPILYFLLTIADFQALF